MDLYLIRHGESTANRDKAHAGWLPVPLTEEGVRQAKAVGELLRDIPFDRFYYSDVYRTVQTFDHAFGADHPREYSTLLREISSGDLAGKLHADCAAEYGELYDRIRATWAFDLAGGENSEHAMDRGEALEDLSASGRIGVGWATSGGEASALMNDSYLAADGIENVIRVLDQIENGNIGQLEFVELNACPGGCVGGVLTVQNPFMARARLHILRRYMPVSRNFLPADEHYIPAEYFFDETPAYQPIARLSGNIAKSMRMMAEIQSLRATLPGLDCGACGAPTCRAFAEDVVRGTATLDDCLVCRVLPKEGDQ